MVRLMRKLVLFGLIGVVACQPSDRDHDRDVAADTLSAVTAETHRQQVQTAVRETREGVNRRESRIAERSEDTWDRISAQASETWGEIESSLAGIGDDDPESIHQNREDTARRLAELEAELANADVRTARTPEEFRDVSDEWLNELESDVGQLEQLLPQAADRADIDRDDLQDMREQMRELRADIQETLTDDENFEDRRESVADDLSDLVQEVREVRYRVEWSHSRTATR